MKGNTEAKVREALESIDPLTWWKPPDDARNWKPADFLVWWPETRHQTCGDFTYGAAGMIEVKDNAALNGFPVKDLRPIQRSYMRIAERVRVPYLLVCWWRRWSEWSVSDATRVLNWIEANEHADVDDHQRVTSVPRSLLIVTAGVSCPTSLLPATIAAGLRGEL